MDRSAFLPGQGSHRFLLALKALRSFETVFSSRKDVTSQNTFQQPCCGKLNSLKTITLRLRTFSLFRIDSLTYIEYRSLKQNLFVFPYTR